MVNGKVLLYSYGYVGIMQSLACWSVFLFVMPRMMQLFREDRHPSDYTAEDVQADFAGMTAYYWTLVLAQVGAALATTTVSQSVFSYGIFRNGWLTCCFAFEILLALLVIYAGPCQNIFKTASLSFVQLMSGMAGFLLVSAVEEMRKLYFRRSTPCSPAIDEIEM